VRRVFQRARQMGSSGFTPADYLALPYAFSNSDFDASPPAARQFLSRSS
jgi:hypothetical protein